jgi:hypothetical protein
MQTAPASAPRVPGVPMGPPTESAYARPASVPSHQSFETPPPPPTPQPEAPAEPAPEQRDEKQ